jgi:hypothetical protein
MKAAMIIGLLWLALSCTGLHGQTPESTPLIASTAAFSSSDSVINSMPASSLSTSTTQYAPELAMAELASGNTWVEAAGWHSFAEASSSNCSQAPIGTLSETPGGGLSLRDFSVHGEFTRDHMMKMARNFYPSQPLPDAPSYTPMTSREKFEGWARHTYSFDMFSGAAIDSLILQATGGYRDYGGGMQGYVKRYGTTLLAAEATSLFGRWIFPTILHQDPRYFPSGQTNVWDRMAYAASRTIITRSDSGRDVFNSSLILTLLVSSALANGYKPNYDESFPATMANTFAGLGTTAQMNLLNEFWPDLKSMFTKQPPAQYVQKKLNDLAIKKKKD